MTRYLSKAQHFVTHMFHLTMQLYNASLKQCYSMYMQLKSSAILRLLARKLMHETESNVCKNE